jgi:hypothetical protein
LAQADSEDFLALKQALQLYVQSRTVSPPAECDAAARELGELLVSLVSTADKLKVDLVRAAEEHISRRAANMPRLVPVADKVPAAAETKNGVDKR